MEINSNASVSLQNTQNNAVKPTELSNQNVEKSPSQTQDTVSISDEAQALFNEGGGHPTRPVKK